MELSSSHGTEYSVSQACIPSLSKSRKRRLFRGAQSDLAPFLLSLCLRHEHQRHFRGVCIARRYRNSLIGPDGMESQSLLSLSSVAQTRSYRASGGRRRCYLVYANVRATGGRCWTTWSSVVKAKEVNMAGFTLESKPNMRELWYTRSVTWAAVHHTHLSSFDRSFTQALDAEEVSRSYI